MRFDLEVDDSGRVLADQEIGPGLDCLICAILTVLYVAHLALTVTYEPYSWFDLEVDDGGRVLADREIESGLHCLICAILTVLHVPYLALTALHVPY